MVGDINLKLADVARNPSDTFSIRTQNRDFATQGLSSEEADLFEEQFNVLLNDLDSRIMTDLMMQRQQEIGEAAALAKNQFDEKLFGGINAADNEIGFDVLRPGHIRSDPSTGNVENDWYYEPSNSGWNDWIGDGSSANDYTVDEDQIVVVFGFADQDPNTEISALNVDRFGRNVDMLPKDLNHSRMMDNDNDLMMQAIPTFIGSDRDRVHLRLRHDRATESQPRLLGVTFGVGAYLNQEDF